MTKSNDQRMRPHAMTEEEPATDEQQYSRYVVGIDLGTTNSAVCYVDADESPWTIRTFRLPQLVAPGEVEARETLPSFHYQPAAAEFSAEALRLPWSEEPPGYAVGLFAREQGRLSPTRMIDSAKSWLCHPGVDRTAPLLPWHRGADVETLSPVEVSFRYLQHMRAAWDAEHPAHPLAEQDLVLTLPASFDEVARKLTVEAARRDGLRRVVLIEEPQAAFYSWIDSCRDDWESHVSPGQKILICDIGGGTSDFTLIRVRRQADGKIQFHRVAVGEHLLLGGDNFDLALAHDVEHRLAGDAKLEPRQWSVLIRSCRHVKETMLSQDAPEQMTVNLPGAGARLIGGGLQAEVRRDEVRKLLVDGFFPQVSLDEKPARRQSGFQEFGLPYAADAAITRHLAAFLTAHRDVALDDVDASDGHDPARPDIVLLNGGVFAATILRDRLLDVLRGWFSNEDSDWQPIILQNERLDLAVARGAAYYGMVRRGEGVRIDAGLARSYFIEVAADPPAAICLVPAGVEPGADIHLTSQTFELSLQEPVEFPLYVSSTRLTDRPGELVAVDREQMSPLPPIRTVLRSRKQQAAATVKVQLHARLTEIGTLELWCSEINGRRSWQLQFDVRAATQTDVEAHAGLAEQQGVVERESVETCRRMVCEVFGDPAQQKPGGLPRRMARAIEISRDDWPPTLLRQIWEALIEVESGRRTSAAHEARWLNLLGFSLRPGYGLAVDDWRVAETWRLLKGKLVHATPMCRTEGRILWRRIAGGLTAGQQTELALPLLALIRQKHRQITTGRGKGADFASSTHEEAEVWRMLGSFERLDLAVKIELGDMLLDLMRNPDMEASRTAMVWALGRIGARLPLYGALNSVVPVDVVGGWLPRLFEINGDESVLQLALMQLARRTNDRFRDLPEPRRREALDHLTALNPPEHFLTLVREGGQLGAEEQRLIFGESLPRGLRIL